MGKITKPVIDLEGLPEVPAWYLVATKYNYQEEYAKNLAMGLEAKNMTNKIVEWFVPIKYEQVEVTNKKGVTTLKEKKVKVLENYVYVKAVMDEFVWDYLRTTVGAATVIAPDGRPAITLEEDVNRMKALCK